MCFLVKLKYLNVTAALIYFFCDVNQNFWEITIYLHSLNICWATSFWDSDLFFPELKTISVKYWDKLLPAYQELSVIFLLHFLWMYLFIVTYQLIGHWVFYKVNLPDIDQFTYLIFLKLVQHFTQLIFLIRNLHFIKNTQRW